MNSIVGSYETCMRCLGSSALQSSTISGVDAIRKGMIISIDGLKTLFISTPLECRI